MKPRRIQGVIAVFMSELTAFALYTYVLHLEFQLSMVMWLVVPLISAVCVTLAGLWGVKEAVNQPTTDAGVARELN